MGDSKYYQGVDQLHLLSMKWRKRYVAETGWAFVAKLAIIITQKIIWRNMFSFDNRYHEIIFEL